MITKKNTIKSILGCTTACSALLLGGVGAMDMLKPNYETYAKGVNQIPVSITNANFNSNTQSTYPYSPNGYTAYNQNKQVTSSNSDIKANVDAGVINLSNEKYETRFAAAKRTSLDNYVLMIDSTDKDDPSTKHTVNYGFRTNNAFKLDANSKYMFTVDVFNVTNAKIANLYLYDNDGEVFSSIANINSYNNWTTYTFFVATNNIEGQELKLGMYLEGAGTVLFDNISGFKLSDNEYGASLKNSVTGTFNEKDTVDNVVKVFKINSKGQLVDAEDETSTSNFSHVEYGFNSKTSMTTDSTSNATDGENSHALLIKNEEKTFSQFETEEVFSFEQNRIYKVSVNVKTKNLDGTASLQMIRTDIAEDDKDYKEDLNKTIKITSNTVSTAESVTNDYKTYSFLINTHNSKTLTFKLKFGLGLEDALTSGEMYVSEIEISKIDYETYNSASTGSGVEKIDFVNAYKNSKIMLDNGDFNAFKIEDYNAPMPAEPVDWNVTIGKNTQKHGVVNTSSFSDLSSLELSNLSNPSADKNNNILMMYNETADTLSYTSTSKNLSAKTYHKFEINVQTQNAPLTLSLVSKKDDKEIVLCSKTVNTNYAWQNVTLYLYTGYQAHDVSLKATLNTTAYGYAYLDDAKFDYILTSAQLEEEFKSASNSTYTAVADLTNFVESASDDKFAPSTLFNAEKVSGVQSGTITLNSSYLDEVIYDVENLEYFNSLANQGENKKVLGIWTTEDVNYSIVSNVGFKLTTGEDKYYKISVAVYTQDIDTNNNETDKEKIGAGIKLSGLSNAFTSIKSNNQWTTYTFYVQAESDTTTYLELSLGNENAKTKGSVFFGDITFVDDVTADEYNSIKESETVKVVKTEQKKSEEETTDETTETENKTSSSTWIYLIPSLLTALAIIIAIVGFAVRKIKWKKPVKKSKTSYDRNKTVSVQYYSRKATAMREEKIRELNADLNKINAERKQFEEDYKKDLTKLREMKIKRANPAEIAKLEKELKKNQKLSASLGVTANRIADELSYTKSDAYLASLIRKLSREPIDANKNKEN